jgi:hypothetical protein
MLRDQQLFVRRDHKDGNPALRPRMSDCRLYSPPDQKRQANQASP